MASAMLPRIIVGTGQNRERSMVEHVTRPIVEAVTDAVLAKAPDGWEGAVLHGQAGRGGSCVSGGYRPRGDGWGASLPDVHLELAALAEELRADRGWEAVSVEIGCRPSGEYWLVAFRSTVTSVTGADGFQVVLDDDYRLPQPGVYAEPGTAAPAGDPEVAVARMRAYLERRAAILGHAEELPRPPPSPRSTRPSGAWDTACPPTCARCI
ncbi:hypothetical protein [Streptomyces sp. G45]|uniref:hypothetical protein n=1 Tax=Streptomyces sp. G45 TaxID=3406627 RepID=UPI003C1456B1